MASSTILQNKSQNQKSKDLVESVPWHLPQPRKANAETIFFSIFASVAP
jgi:hypothetical protein